MRKAALVFIIAILVPSLVLAWLALRSASAQQIASERRRELLCQTACEGLVKDVHEHIGQLRAELTHQTEVLLAGQEADEVARHFDERITKLWPIADVGFAVTAEGNILSPPLLARKETERFRLNNDLFLSSQERVEVYWQAIDSQSDHSYENLAIASNAFVRTKPSELDSQKRSIKPEEAEFRQLVGKDTDGVIARFLQDRLALLLWYRPPSNPQLIFGAELNLEKTIEKLSSLISLKNALTNDICVALLDHTAHPRVVSLSGFRARWDRPLAAVPIGSALPHWEIAAYPLNPGEMARSSQMMTLTFALLATVLVAAILIGAVLIAQDIRREMISVRQKTDFVSNVSHELKTPLTSIRMFCELLAENKVESEEKRRLYFSIITTEVSRLTRLINNVLDFSSLERGAKKYHFERCDLAEVVRKTVESFRPELESKGFSLAIHLPEHPLTIRGDTDALSQVLLNLISNAEKYSSKRKEITIAAKSSAKPGYAEVTVLDRGDGVPAGCEEKIFEQFYRADHSLSSSTHGAGLGLTLARQIARDHGGDVIFAPRTDGGSCFAIRLPLL